MRKYKHLDTLPIGRASDEITEGCLVLEGGAWQGLYTVGVLDAMMENDLNLRAQGIFQRKGYHRFQLSVQADPA